MTNHKPVSPLRDTTRGKIQRRVEKWVKTAVTQQKSLGSRITAPQGKDFIRPKTKQRRSYLGSAYFMPASKNLKRNWNTGIPPQIISEMELPSEEDSRKMAEAFVGDIKRKGKMVSDAVRIIQKQVIPIVEKCMNDSELGRCIVDWHISNPNSPLNVQPPPTRAGWPGLVDWTTQEYLPKLIDAVTTAVATAIIESILEKYNKS